MKRIFLHLIIFFVAFAQATPKTPAVEDTAKALWQQQWVGWSIFATEFFGGAVLASQYWWKHGLGRNPFENVVEQEPYLEDKMWHFWNGVNLTDLHYWTLKTYYSRDDPAMAMAMTFVVLTAVETFDASDKDGKWGFSIYDEAANIGGILFWYLKHRYPGRVPVDIRVGIRRWDKVERIIRRGANFGRNFDRGDPNECCPMSHYDNYSILKAELVVRVKKYLTVSFAASLPTDENGCGIPGDLWGIGIGFDPIAFAKEKYPDKVPPFVNTLSRYGSVSIGYTWWCYERIARK